MALSCKFLLKPKAILIQCKNDPLGALLLRDCSIADNILSMSRLGHLCKVGRYQPCMPNRSVAIVDLKRLPGP